MAYTIEGLEDHQKRVIGEVIELRDKLDKLEIFIYSNPEWNDLEQEERERMIMQVHIMRAYREILDQRIRYFMRTRENSGGGSGSHPVAAPD